MHCKESLEQAACHWQSGDILVLGNGPSLEALDSSKITIPTMGVNRSCRLHISEFHTMHDHPSTWKAYNNASPRSRFHGFQGLDNERRFQRSQILFLFDPCNRSIERWVCKKLGIQYDSHSSGEYALITCAFLGYRRFWLIGYDCNDNQGHAKSLLKDEKDWPLDRESKGHAQHFDQVAKVLDKLSVEVINCNPESAIKCWPFPISYLAAIKNQRQ